MILDKKHLEHLAALTRIELHAYEEAASPKKAGEPRLIEEGREKLLKDLEKILEHFNELKVVNTENVAPMAGGTELKNVTRGDLVREDRLGPDRAVDAFPEKEGRYLKVPPVFE